jgi:hypothetical protein
VSDLTAEHRDLMTEHHDLGLLRSLAATQQHKPAEDPDREQVEQPKSHDWRSWRSMLIRAKLQVTDLRGVLTQYNAIQVLPVRIPSRLIGILVLTQRHARGTRRRRHNRATLCR